MPNFPFPLSTEPLSTVEGEVKEGTIFIVDDEKDNVCLLENVLGRAGYTDVHSTLDAREACSLVGQIQPDVLLLDLAMPHMSGFEVMEQLHSEADGSVPVVVLTADKLPQTRLRALQHGACDLLVKPLDQTEVLLRIDNLLKARFHNSLLEQKVGERTRELERAQIETLHRLALAAEYREDGTGEHARRVAHTAALLAQQLGLHTTQIELIRRATPLHDVGKIGVADSILLKPGKLTLQEFEAMKRHTIIGAQMLGGSASASLQLAEEIAFFHHERWDGEGYASIEGEKIPLSGRIVAVADVFDALTHERSYKSAWPLDEAVAEVEAQSGRQFDAKVVEAFAQLDHTNLI